MKVKRFTYHEEEEKSHLPFLIKVAGRILFNTNDVTPSVKRVRRYEEMLLESDREADAVINEIFGQGKGRSGHALMKEALERGIDQVDNAPPKFKAYMKKSETDPVWLDRKKLNLGAHVCRRLGDHALYALGDMALLGGYSNASITKPLIFTGNLMGGKTFDRLTETSLFWLDVTAPNGLKVGAPGYCAAVHVRLMHALMRKKILKQEKWDTEKWGLPINSADAVATNIAFSMLMVVGVMMLGHYLNRKEVEGVLHLWRYIGHLMGDNTDWLPETVEEGLQCLLIVALSDSYEPDEDSIGLANDYLDSFYKDKKGIEKQLDGYYQYWKNRAYAQYLIPGNIYRRLRLPSSKGTWMIPALQTPFVFAADRFRTLIPGAQEWLDKEGRKQQEMTIYKRIDRKTNANKQEGSHSYTKTNVGAHGVSTNIGE